MTGEAGKRDKWDDADKPEPDSNRRYAAKSDGYANAPDDDAENAQPLPLLPELQPAKNFPVEALPPVMAAAVEAISSKIQVGIEMAVQSVMGAAALATQGYADVRLPHGQVRPISLYLCSIAETGERKTTSDNEAQKGIFEFVKDRRELEDAEREAWKVRHAVWAGQKRKIENDKDLDIEQRTRRMEELGSEPLEPLKPELTFGDPTIEGLIKNWPRSQASLGIFTTEGAQIFGGYGMNDDNRSKTGGALSELWDGTPVKRNRASDLTSVYGRRLAMHIMVQPVIVRGFLSSHELRGQGLISRILIAAPNSRRGSRLFERPTQAQNDAIDAFAERILNTLSRPLPLAQGKRNELRPPVINIGPAAEEVWREFYDRTELRCGKGEIYHDLAGFADKAGEQVCRIAAIFTVLSDPSALTIDERHHAPGRHGHGVVSRRGGPTTGLGAGRADRQGCPQLAGRRAGRGSAQRGNPARMVAEARPRKRYGGRPYPRHHEQRPEPGPAQGPPDGSREGAA